MKILHIVAYSDENGAYGGPTSVANAQSSGLSAAHSVTVLSGAKTSTMDDVSGTLTRVFRRAHRLGASFSSLVSVALPLWVLRNRHDFDVVHIHLGRDFAVVPAAMVCLLTRTPYVLQTHGMIRAKPGLGLRIYDALSTKPLLRGAASILTLTDAEEHDVRLLAQHDRVLRIRNAVDVGPAKLAVGANGRRTRVLFCARLHKRKRPSSFIELARNVESLRPGEYEFIVAGPDGGELSRVEQSISEFGRPDVLSYVGSVEPLEVSKLLQSSDLLVLPSEREPFPMIVLEALAQSVPVIVGNDCGLAPIVRGSAGARTVDVDRTNLTEAVLDISRNLPEEAAAARELACREFSIDILVETLEKTYKEAATWHHDTIRT